jgi:hypothetical protein
MSIIRAGTIACLVICGASFARAQEDRSAGFARASESSASRARWFRWLERPAKRNTKEPTTSTQDRLTVPSPKRAREQIGTNPSAVRRAQNIDTPDLSAVQAAQTEVARPQPALVASESQSPQSETANGPDAPTTTDSDTQRAGTPAAREDSRGLLMRALSAPDDSPWKLRGWIENSFTYNANGFGNGLNFGVAPNTKANQWMGNQYYFIAEKPLKQDDTVNFGFRMDNMFGNDWQFTYMQGLFNGAFRNGSFAGYDMPQLFGEMHLPILTPGGLDIKGGRWYTITGYESVPAADRTLLSVPDSFTYGQPFTHVGVLTTLHVTEKINLFNGSINGWDRWIDQRYLWGYIGGFNWASPDDKNKLSFATVWGPNQFPSFLPANQPIYPTGYINVPSVAGLNNPGYHRNDRTAFTIVGSHKWTEKLTQFMGTGGAVERSIPGLGATVIDGVPQSAKPKDDTWYGYVNMFGYAFNDKLTGVWRSEVFWDTNGARTGLLVGDRYYEMTLALRYKPKNWLLIRPEARYDWSQFHRAYSNDTRKSQFTLGIDVLLLF